MLHGSERRLRRRRCPSHRRRGLLDHGREVARVRRGSPASLVVVAAGMVRADGGRLPADAGRRRGPVRPRCAAAPGEDRHRPRPHRGRPLLPRLHGRWREHGSISGRRIGWGSTSAPAARPSSPTGPAGSASRGRARSGTRVAPGTSTCASSRPTTSCSSPGTCPARGAKRGSMRLVLRPQRALGARAARSRDRAEGGVVGELRPERQRADARKRGGRRRRGRARRSPVRRVLPAGAADAGPVERERPAEREREVHGHRRRGRA